MNCDGSSMNEEMDLRLEVEAISREVCSGSLIDFVSESMDGYKAGWVHHEVCEKLEQFIKDVIAEKNPRLGKFLPPGSGKSFLSSERFPAWVLGRAPWLQFIVSSYGASLADDFSGNTLDLCRGEYFRGVFPKFKLGRKQTFKEWKTSKGGAYRSAGIGGPITGKRAHVFVIDDPFKDWMEAMSQKQRDTVWNWYQSVAYTRLHPGGGILMIQTRWHHDDLAGRVMDAMDKMPDADKWKIVSYPAIAETDEVHRKKGEALHPERYSLPLLTSIMANLASKIWTSLYQQRPSEQEGTEFKRRHFRFFRHSPIINRIVISVDANFKAAETTDNVSIQVIGEGEEGNYYLLDNVTKNMGFLDTCKEIDKLLKVYPASTLLIEEAANGMAIIDTMVRKYENLNVVGLNPLGGKVARARAMVHVVEGGHFYVWENGEWKETYLDEMCTFPFGAYDDQVDATTQAINYLMGNTDEGQGLTIYTATSYSRR